MRNLVANKWILYLLVILLLANICLILFFWVFGEGGRYGLRGKHEDNFRVFAEKMHLTSEQEKMFRTMKDKHFMDMRPLWETIRMTKDTLYRQLADPSVADSSSLAIASRLANLNQDADLRLFRHFKEVRQNCTPDQQKIFDTLVPRMMSRPWGTGRMNPVSK